MKQPYLLLFFLLFVVSARSQDSLRSTCRDNGPEDYRKTIAQYTDYLAKHPDNQQALYALGMSYYSLRDFKTAIAMFDKLISINPHYGAVFLNRGICKIMGKDNKGACEDFKSCIEMDKDYDDVLEGKSLSAYIRDGCK